MQGAALCGLTDIWTMLALEKCLSNCSNSVGYSRAHDYCSASKEKFNLAFQFASIKIEFKQKMIDSQNQKM
jgi:hypothetical protein